MKLWPVTSNSKYVIYWAILKGEPHNILTFFILNHFHIHQPDIFCEAFQQIVSDAFLHGHIISDLLFQNLQDVVPNTETYHVPALSKNLLINGPSACLYKAKNITDCSQGNLRTPENTEAISA